MISLEQDGSDDETITRTKVAHSFHPSSARANEAECARNAPCANIDRAGLSIVGTVACLYVTTLGHVWDLNIQRTQDMGFVTSVSGTDAQQTVQLMFVIQPYSPWSPRALPQTRGHHVSYLS